MVGYPKLANGAKQPDSLTVTIPTSATTGAITVTSPDGSGTGPTVTITK